MQTSHKPTDLPKPPEEPQDGTILSEAPATGTGSSLGTAQPDATAALCQPKQLTGAQLQMGTCPSCFPEKVKLRARSLTARLARQELQETAQLARQGICRRLTPTAAQQEPQHLWHQTWEFWFDCGHLLLTHCHLPEIGNAGRSLWILKTASLLQSSSRSEQKGSSPTKTN